MATRNRYAEIMSQYRQSQPFSFTGMPSTYTGGYGGYPSDYTGGFTPYQRPAPAPALPVQQDQYAEIIRQLGGGNAGDREGPSAWSQMTPAERAAYYRENPIQGSIALGMQDLFGNATLLGNAAKYFGADGWYDSRLEKQGLDPESFAYGPPDPNFSSQAAAAARSEAAAAERAAQTAQDANADRDSQGGSRDGGGGYTSQPRGDSGGSYGPSSQDGGDGGSGYAKGGPVSMQHLLGPDPAGPDDGYAALKDGEYVINDRAVKKYGIELMEAINSGKISKGKLRGLLEM